MTTLMLCLGLLMFIPLTLALASIPIRLKQFGQVDFHTPRLQAGQLQGAGHRLNAAQANAWEALMLFVTTLLIVSIAGVDLKTIVLPASLFVAARLIHAFSYIANLAFPRTASFFFAIGMLIWILSSAV